MTLISIQYVNLVKRFIENVGPKSIAKLSKDTGIPAEKIDGFIKDQSLMTSDEIMKIWIKLFNNKSHLQASLEMDALNFDL